MTDQHQDGDDQQNRSAQNTFTALKIDRVLRRRRDAAWVSERLKDPTTRFLAVCGSKVLITDESPPHPLWLRPEDVKEHLRQAESVILLGEHAERGTGDPGDTRHPRAYFALGMPINDEAPWIGAARTGTFRRLRAVAALLDGETAALLAYAKAMVHYHRYHQFCAICGAPTTSKAGGYLRVCTNARCGHQDFPRTDPAIIVLVSSRDRCLLGRQPTWPENLYSTIAGFVEPGESLEAAVAREVREETGVQVEHVRYHSSQPWPFPRSLMIGFTATARSTTIQLSDGELEDARWLSREDIVRELEQDTLQLPSPISISYRLIESWFNIRGPVPLQDVLGAE